MLKSLYFRFVKMLKFLLGALAVSVQAYFVEIDAHKEECFHEKVTSGTKVRKTLVKP